MTAKRPPCPYHHQPSSANPHKAKTGLDYLPATCTTDFQVLLTILCFKQLSRLLSLQRIHQVCIILCLFINKQNQAPLYLSHPTSQAPPSPTCPPGALPRLPAITAPPFANLAKFQVLAATKTAQQLAGNPSPKTAASPGTPLALHHVTKSCARSSCLATTRSRTMGR